MQGPLGAEKNDMVILVPHELMGEGETGEPFPDEFQTFLRCLSMTGWWPVDFGEGWDNHTTLWLRWDDDPNAAKAQTEHFIKVGGDV